MSKITIYDSKEIDTKHSIADTLHGLMLIKTETKEPIPEEEPVILFRGRDKLAVSVLQEYKKMCIAEGCTPNHMESLDIMLEKFINFKKWYPDRIKQPGSSLRKIV